MVCTSSISGVISHVRVRRQEVGNGGHSVVRASNDTRNRGSLPADDVEILTDAQEAVLTCGSAEFGLITMPVEDFPTLPAMPPVVGAVGGGVGVREAVRR